MHILGILSKVWHSLPRYIFLIFTPGLYWLSCISFSFSAYGQRKFFPFPISLLVELVELPSLGKYLYSHYPLTCEITLVIETYRIASVTSSIRKGFPYLGPAPQISWLCPADALAQQMSTGFSGQLPSLTSEPFYLPCSGAHQLASAAPTVPCATRRSQWR